MKAVNAFWEKNIEAIRRATIRNCGYRAKITYHRDKNGDYDGIESIYATLRAELVDRDLELVIDVTANPPKNGLAFSDFCGFRDARKGEDDAFNYAVFADGNSYRVVDWRTPEITAPAELTARELRFSRMQRDVNTQTPGADEEGKKRPYKSWPKPDRDKVRALWVRYSSNEPDARYIDCYETHKHDLPECIESKDDFENCLAAAQKAETKRKATERRWNHVSSR